MVAFSMEQPVDAAVTSTMTSDFPPCTAERCQVGEEEKKASISRARPSCEMTEKCVNACAAYGRVCPCEARVAAHAACDAMLELQEDSVIFQTGMPNFSYFDDKDIIIGEKLGEGGFSYVNVCTVTAPNHPDANSELAIKYLKRKAMMDLHTFKHGAADLAVEAFFLQSLDHPNIVKLHGIAAGSVETNVASGKECGFFIVVDRLHDTLEKRIEVWRNREILSSKNFINRLSTEFKQTKRAEVMERCGVALEIAQAMKYLHSLGIIFRDLKPDNIGFDKNGVLKLFDFGLAKELKHPTEDGTYQLTGKTGSRRYMAPEVSQDLPYNESVDVYSFGILLWELCSTEKPFYGYSSNKHMQLVVLGGERPMLDSAHTAFWPRALVNLMKLCWHADAARRPSFDQIITVLESKILSTKPSLESQTSSCSEEGFSVEDMPVLPGENLRTSTSSTGSMFSHLFPLSLARRSLTGTLPGAPISKPAAGNTRSKSWGFGTKR